MMQSADVPPVDDAPDGTDADRSMPVQPARGAEIGALIGGAFGLVFLLVNSAGFSTLGRILVLVMGLGAFALILVLSLRSLGRSRRRRAAGDSSRPSATPFTRSYWIIVAVEVLALIGGAKLLSGLGYPELGVAWVSVVVGTHFFALGRVFGLRRFHLLVGVVTLCGIAGFIAFALSAPDFVPVLAGVIPGFVLLAFGLWALAPAEAQR